MHAFFQSRIKKMLDMALFYMYNYYLSRALHQAPESDKKNFIMGL